MQGQPFDPRKIIIAINGYGVPQTPDEKEQLREYIHRCLEKVCQVHPQLERATLRECQYVFMGGNTNDTQRTEAEVLRRAVVHELGAGTVTAHLIDTTTFARDNIQELMLWLCMRAVKGQRTHIFCHTTRVATTEAFVSYFARQSRPGLIAVHGVHFDGGPPASQLHHWVETTALTPVIGAPLEIVRLVARSWQIWHARRRTRHAIEYAG